jgi:hypothetical protein
MLQAAERHTIQRTPIFMKRLILTAAALLLLPTAVHAKKVDIKEISANSTLTDKEKGIVYSADKMLNDNVADMWIEGEGSSGLGKYVGVKFDGDVEVAKIRIWPGCFVDKDFWGRHNRIKDLEFKFPDFTSERITLEDTMEPQWIELKEAKTLNNVKIYLRAVYEGSTWNDTPITKIEFFDKGGVVEPIEGLKATASSEYDDEEGSYKVSKAVDGWLDTHWVEGGASGEGEWIDVDLGGSKTVKKFGISTGFDATDSFFEGANRAASVTLTFSDGSTKDIALEDKQGLQMFDLGVTTSTVKVTIKKVVKGKTTDDLYIGELRFWQ